MPHTTLDPSSGLTPQQRRKQVAGILARGLLRTLQQARSADDFAAKTLEFSTAGLEVPGETRFSVSRVPEVL
jgi:hypothetical protein